MNHKEYCKQQYQLHKEERKKKSIENYWANREKRIPQMREYGRNRRINNPEWAEKDRERLRELYRKNIAWYQIRNSKQAKTEKQKARMALVNAVLNGKIKRPKKCDNCSIKCKPEGHHYKGYKHPFSVIWLCRNCHSILHRKH